MDPASVTVQFQGINPYSWKVEIGYAPGANDIYPGTEILASSGYVDNGVVGLPDATSLCYTKVKYRTAAGGTWKSLIGNGTTFTCI
jgi:hypothetical protein